MRFRRRKGALFIARRISSRLHCFLSAEYLLHERRHGVLHNVLYVDHLLRVLFIQGTQLCQHRQQLSEQEPGGEEPRHRY